MYGVRERGEKEWEGATLDVFKRDHLEKLEK